MSRNGSGTYSLPEAAFVYDTVIDETAVNSNFSDIASALTASIAKDGQTVPSANLPMGTYKHTGVGNASARDQYAAMGQVQDGAGIWCGTAGGTADAITLTPSPAIPAYAAGQRFEFKAGAASNTGAVTFAISGLSTIAGQVNGAACVAGDIEANQWYRITLSDASTAQIERIGVVSGGDVSGPASATANAIALFDGTGGKTIKDSTYTITAAGAALLDDANPTAQRATLGLVIGTDVLAPNGSGESLTGIGLQGIQTIWIPAGAMTARTTNGAASGTSESTTNKVMTKSLDFDTATQEFAQFNVRFPKSWDEGTVTFAPVWTAASGSGGVVFGLAGVALSDDDAIDTAYGAAQTSTDTLITANDIHVGPASSAITIAGTPAVGDWVSFQVNRTVSDGSDTLGVDARLLGVVLLFTTNAGNDA